MLVAYLSDLQASFSLISPNNPNFTPIVTFFYHLISLSWSAAIDRFFSSLVFVLFLRPGGRHDANTMMVDQQQPVVEGFSEMGLRQFSTVRARAERYYINFF